MYSLKVSLVNYVSNPVDAIQFLDGLCNLVYLHDLLRLKVHLLGHLLVSSFGEDFFLLCLQLLLGHVSVARALRFLQLHFCFVDFGKSKVTLFDVRKLGVIGLIKDRTE